MWPRLQLVILFCILVCCLVSLALLVVLCDLGLGSKAPKVIRASGSLPQRDVAWLAWKHQLNISFYTIEEEFYRYGVWRKNMEFIKQHNAEYATGAKLYRMRANQFTHMEHWEFVERHLRSRVDDANDLQDYKYAVGNETLASDKAYAEADCSSTPTDWRRLSSGSVIKNQVGEIKMRLKDTFVEALRFANYGGNKNAVGKFTTQ
ncbi:unnamed protein product [Dibothriocephalus latus]|uniref:Cathepsin propeptide inhibitor domain-containing protein n=1 Tax=Dibothriocephalus latus TaxID=60516 RepID=A0A3P7NMQ6_DIBLA|nr:unnamed protein product [Dibothriocephalus latus]